VVFWQWKFMITLSWPVSFSMPQFVCGKPMLPNEYLMAKGTSFKNSRPPKYLKMQAYGMAKMDITQKRMMRYFCILKYCHVITPYRMYGHSFSVIFKFIRW